MRIWTLIILGCTALHGASPAKAAQILHRLSMEIEVAADGTYTRLMRTERMARTDEAAKAIGQFPMSYSPSRTHVEVIEAYTEKVGGEKLPVAADSIREQLPNGSPNLEMFTDQRQKIIIYPRVAKGDKVIAVVRQTNFATQFQGLFSTAYTFTRTEQWDEVRISIRAPATMILRVDQLGFRESRSMDEETAVYEWVLEPRPALTEDNAVLAPTDRPVPRLIVTSATDWEELGRAYAALARPKEAVTPRIQAKADEITAGTRDRRKQAELLHDWVSDNIRYVAVYLGNGGVEPHAADSILANGYGDCKDHVALLGALLRAKSIDSVPVLINAGSSYRLSVPAPFPQLNHVITYIPEFGVYVDSTAAAANFGILPFAEYGKPVVHADGEGPALRQIPPLAPDIARVSMTTTATLTPDGRITGETVTDAWGPFAHSLRMSALSVQRIGSAAAAARQIRALGDDGTGRLSVPPINLRQESYSVSGSFDIEGQTYLASDVSLSVPVGLLLLRRPGDVLLGPASMRGLPATEATPCYAGHQIETLSLTLPDDRQITRLPAGRTIDKPDFTYTSRWTQDGQTVTVRRELVSRIAQPLCKGALRQDAAQALQEIRRDWADRALLADR